MRTQVLDTGGLGKRGVALVLCACVALSAHPVAWAQGVATATQASAKDRLKAGAQAAKAGEWARALQEYSAAIAASPSAEALQGVAGAHDRLGNTPKAYEALDDLLKTYPNSLSAEARTKAGKRLAELATVTGAVSIRAHLEGASVYFDGALMGTTPVPQLVRVTSGAHQVRATKDGYVPFEQAINIQPNGRVVVTVELKQEAQTGKLMVKEKSRRAIRVLLDGVDVGAVPFEVDLAPKTYEVSGRGPGLAAPPKVVSVEKGKSIEVELEAVGSTARIEIRTSDNVGAIFLDGQPVGQGTFAGDVAPGEHRIRVERAGYTTYAKTLTVSEKQVVAETVTLQQRVEGVGSGGGRGTRIRDGIYGGFQAGMALMPWGADTSIDLSCDTLGASSCASDSPSGALLSGYAGYSLDPIGFELLIGALADVASPSATFDGVYGSSINPLVAQPAREEKFTILRVGGLGAARVRGNLDLSETFQASAALGVGLSWRKLLMRRSATATDGTDARHEFVPDPVSYLSPGVSIDVSARLMLGETTSLSAGIWFWGETAKENARTEADPNRVMVSESDSVAPRPIATPEFDLANGSQLYVGPHVGMQFGP